MKSLAPHSGLRKPGRTLSKLLARLEPLRQSCQYDTEPLKTP